MGRNNFHLLTGTILICLLFSVVLFSDDGIAREFLAKGDEAMKKGDAERAVEFYQKAVKESPDMPEAHCKLGEAYMKADDKIKSRKSFKKCLSLINNLEKPSSALVQIKKKAEEAITKLDIPSKESQEMEKEGRAIQQEYAKQLLAFAKKARAKDNGITEDALNRLLAMEPNNTEAQKMRDEVRTRVIVPKWKILNLADNLAGWTQDRPADWKVDDGRILSCDAMGISASNIKDDLYFEDDFKILMDVRFDEATDTNTRTGPYIIGVMFDSKKAKERKGLAILDEKVMKIVGFTDGEKQDLFSKPLPENYKKNDWNKLQIEVASGETIRVYLNDTLAMEAKTPLKGALTIWMQWCRGQVANIKYIK